MAFIYSESNGLNDSKIGRLATPLKMVIEAESDSQRKKGGALDWLFNIERSSRYGETIQYQDEFGAFTATPEGTGAESDSIVDTYRKFIEHIPFMKEFTITKQMMDDSVFGIGSDAKRRAQNFVRAYYPTILLYTIWNSNYSIPPSILLSLVELLPLSTLSPLLMLPEYSDVLPLSISCPI